MGEAKRRKKLDPNFGKGFGRNQKQGKQKQRLMDSRNHLQSFDVQEGMTRSKQQLVWGKGLKCLSTKDLSTPR